MRYICRLRYLTLLHATRCTAVCLRNEQGTEAGGSNRGAAPVQFEREPEQPVDPFGLDAFIQEATKGKQQ
jgi:hypothetical protein